MNRSRRRQGFGFLFFLGGLIWTAPGPAAPAPGPVIFEWERGIGLRLPGQPAADMYFWVYEWNMFGAMQAGPHTHGTYQLKRTLASDARSATVESPALELRVRAVDDGAELSLRVTNLTDYTWSPLAGVIPCWNPGQLPGTNPSMPLPLNRNFSDPWRTRSFFLSADGLTPLTSRAIHFNAALRAEVEQAAERGAFPFSNKWPTSEVEATASLLVREAEEGGWITGVAWEDFLSVQGHNPWYCLHSCVRVGALKPGETRTLRGRLYLFSGAIADMIRRFRRDFPDR